MYDVLRSTTEIVDFEQYDDIAMTGPADIYGTSAFNQTNNRDLEMPTGNIFGFSSTVPHAYTDVLSISVTDSRSCPIADIGASPDVSFVKMCEEIAESFSNISGGLDVKQIDPAGVSPDMMHQALTEASELEDAVNALVNNEIPGICLKDGCSATVKFRGFCRDHGGARKCEVAGCTKGIQGKNRCIGHGGGKRCTYHSCTKSAQSHGLCKAHGGGVRCKYQGCTKSSQGGGLCRKHGGGRRCQASQGCSRGAQRGDFCAKHGGVRHCSVIDCHRTDRGGGLCEVHRRDRLCTLAGCNKLARSYGLCTMHIREMSQAQASSNILS